MHQKESLSPSPDLDDLCLLFWDSPKMEVQLPDLFSFYQFLAHPMTSMAHICSKVDPPHLQVLTYDLGIVQVTEDILSGMGPVPVRPGSVSTGIDPMRRGPASLEGPPSLLSQQPKRSL